MEMVSTASFPSSKVYCPTLPYLVDCSASPLCFCTAFTPWFTATLETTTCRRGAEARGEASEEASVDATNHNMEAKVFITIDT